MYKGHDESARVQIQYIDMADDLFNELCWCGLASCARLLGILTELAQSFAENETEVLQRTESSPETEEVAAYSQKDIMVASDLAVPVQLLELRLTG
ncbi:hypothetical protein SERLADRAFT_384700 [Serpula lacrymans var. lacrymans S7.9]|uniref:Uncharacterized protein n=1 Tax=Serpula lacrymans var. lacrymans (strain S7.9) TaxID=578457 RepID=F8NRE3_SERL9|nr:uncharacterized protein SERLADRAFT_384700 [Serpula lacrymans var. lacrymans S7.9]EGO26262.1 hypothetical protein SERLADRAFT_384700 [Serpula lacrymans var. lacrymans S7.9]